MINLMMGDCLELLETVEDNSVDLVLTDLPYNITACVWDNIIPFEPMWEQFKRVCKHNAAIVLTSAQPFTTKLIASNYDLFRYTMIWEKHTATGFLNANKMPLRGFEDICVFYNNLPVYNPQKTKGKPYKHIRTNGIKNTSMEYLGVKEYYRSEIHNNGDRYPNSIIKSKNVCRNTVHPTQKPVELMEYLIKTYSNEDDIVIDITMGSGTTGVAAVNTNRSFIGMEMDEGYFKIAKDRINTTKNKDDKVNEMLEF